SPEADRVIVIMGSGAETVQETVDELCSSGEKVGVLKVRLYRPFSAARFLAALPKTVTSIAVLDRTKEPGAPGDPFFLDVVAALYEAGQKPARQQGQAALPNGRASDTPLVIAGRYGLSSK